MSNDYHVVIYDRLGRYPEFIEYFHRLLARSQNALRGRWENFWACEQACKPRHRSKRGSADVPTRQGAGLSVPRN